MTCLFWHLIFIGLLCICETYCILSACLGFEPIDKQYEDIDNLTANIAETEK